MAAGAQTSAWDVPSRRRVPRFQARVPIDVTVLRSGIPATLPGRSVNLCERGLAAVLAGELLPGETVGVEVRLPPTGGPLRTRALVRHQDRVQCGMEFVTLSTEQRAAIRRWMEESKADPEPEMRSSSRSEDRPHATGAPDWSAMDPPGRPNWGRRGPGWVLLPVLALIVALIFWWRWNRSWRELESGRSNQQTISADQPRAEVPSEIMQKLLTHRVEPDYPAAARKAKLQGIVVLKIVVGRDGSVVGIHPVNGPDVLVRSAMDALRGWKFEPYRVNGEPAAVETTVAFEFKP